MKLGSALAIVALAAFAPSGPASAAKDDKLPRCTGKHLRPANPYGTVLPTIPERGLTAIDAKGAGGVPRGTPVPSGASSAPSPSPTNLFPPSGAAPATLPTSSLERVPAIGALGSASTSSPHASISYASC